jgi:GNAT superfamily N-acetyltransferase
MEVKHLDISPEIAARLELAEADAFFDMYCSIPPEIAERKGIGCKRIGAAALIKMDNIPSFVLNRVIGLGVKEQATKENVDEVFEFFKNSKSVFSIQYSPYASPQDLTGYMLEKGMYKKNHWVRFMRPADPVPPAKTELRVTEVGSEHANEFSDIVIKGFNMPEISKDFLIYSFNCRNWHHFMCFDGNIPVATGSVYTRGDVAEIGFAVTLPEYRNKGAQGALISKRIELAKKNGCKYISVETAEDHPDKRNISFHNMIRFGFKECYLRSNYVFVPEGVEY